MLLAQMVAQQLVACDVACVNARDRVVHQKMHIKLRNARGLRDRAESLPQVIPPFRQIAAFLFMLDDVTAFALGREQPVTRLLGVERPANTHHSNQAADHGVRKRYVEGLDLATLRPGYVQDTRAKIDMLDPRLPDRLRAMASQQHEQMEFSTNWILQGRELGEPFFEIRKPERGVAPMFGVPVYG